MRLINSQAKYAALVFMLIMGYGALGDLAVYTVKVPNVNDLEITKGKVLIGRAGRGTTRLILDTGNRHLEFNCSFGKNRTCIEQKLESSYVGKSAEAWWYKTNILPFTSGRRLVQLKVDNQVVIGYEEQKQKYLNEQSSYFPLPTICFLIALFIFLKLQFFKNFIIKRNKL